MNSAADIFVRIEEMEKKVDKMIVDMYYGSGAGNPSLTIRLDRLEQYAKETVQSQRQTRTMMLTTMLSVLGALLAALISAKMGWKI